MKMTQVLIERSKYENVINILKQAPKFLFGKAEYGDNRNQRCALGLILRHFGWDGNRNGDNFFTALYALCKLLNPEKRDLIINFNDDPNTRSFREVIDFILGWR
jgi:hypothetical protein